jgi:uncharacterized membrane protein YfcA
MLAALLLFAVATVGSAAQTTVGFGIALFISPAMFLFLDPAAAVVCTLIAASLVSVLMLAGERERLALERGVTVGLLIPMVPGVLVGAWLLDVVGGASLQVALGLVVLASAAWQARARRRGHHPTRPFAFDGALLPTGFVSGILNGSISTGGPPLAIWMQSVRSTPDQIRHTLAIVFLAMNAIAIASVAVVSSPVIDGEARAALAAALAGVPVGYVAGRSVLDRIDRDRFATIFAAAVAVVGAASLASGLSSI